MLAVLLTACGAGTGDDPDPTGSGEAGAATSDTSESGTAQSGDGEDAATASATTSSSTPPVPLDGLVIAVDPGHNGGNRGDIAAITAPVPDGRGGTKDCNTVGTESDDGYPEHRFTWEAAQSLADALEDAGATVVLSRDSDDGVGPCVDERGTFADDADALVSLHANGTEDRSARGFHVIAAAPGARADDQTAAQSAQLGEAVADSLEDAGFDPNPAYDRVVVRDDLATLNHALPPAIMLEAGEMRSADDARLLASEEGQRELAAALVDALVRTLAAEAP